jgi:hypothetical protein
VAFVAYEPPEKSTVHHRNEYAQQPVTTDVMTEDSEPFVFELGRLPE